jgi:lipoate-protein ligase A
MQFLDLTLPTPQENLACDEALLDLCEQNGEHEILRFWESPQHFLVLGYSNKSSTEVNLDSARRSDVPVLRRCTGGGAVLQGPGCLNYSLILRIPDSGALAHITDTNASLMRRHQEALRPILGGAVEMRGTSDLALGSLKFSGNAQRRKRKFLLFHGTILQNLDIELVERLLPMPSRQPDYRHNRPHREFLTNIATDSTALKIALRQHWDATEPLREIPEKQIAALARDVYASDAWNFKF